MAGVMGVLARVGAWLVLTAACATTAPPSATPTAGPTASPAPTVTTSPTSSPTTAATPSTTVVGPPRAGVWEQLDVAGERPAAREAHSWTVDPDSGLAYLYGGRDGATVLDDLWVFDPRTDAWTRVTPAGAAPAARFGHNAVWVPGRGLVIFAGQAGADFFNDLWLYDPGRGAWSQLPAGGDPPIPRYGSCAVVMGDGRLWISHGFTEDRARFADTRAYAFDAGAWLDQTPSVGDVPVARCLHACFEAEDGRFVLFGGQTTGTAALGDLWTLEPFTEADRWAMVDGTLPAPRNLYGFTRTAGAFIVFGGGAVDGGYLSDTWAFSTFDLRASPVSTSGGPPAGRSGSALVVGGDGRVLLFGGRDGGGAFDDLWALTLS